MNSVIIPLVQEIEQSKAYQFGYEVGYFVGSNFWPVVTVAILLLGAILYFVFFRKSGKKKLS